MGVWFSLKNGMMMNKPEKWEVWLAEVRFEDSPEKKKRPVVIVAPNIAYYLSLKVTTHPPRPQYQGEYALQMWQEAGLARPSTVRSSKLLELRDSDFCQKVGRLHPVDILRLREIVDTLYS